MKKLSYYDLPVQDLLLAIIESLRMSERIYSAALPLAVCKDLRAEWQHQLETVTLHQEVLLSACKELSVDTVQDSQSREMVRHSGDCLIQGFRISQTGEDHETTQIVACEAIVQIENKVLTGLELLGKYALANNSELGNFLKGTYSRLTAEHSLYVSRNKDWCSELSGIPLGLPASLPPISVPTWSYRPPQNSQ